MAKHRKTKAAQRPRDLPLGLGQDPFSVVGPVPVGMSYQWVAIEIFGEATHNLQRAKADGWKAVPARRHPRMPHRDGKIIYGGQLLMQRALKKTAAAREKETSAAIRQFTEHPASNSGAHDTGTIADRCYSADGLETMGRVQELTPTQIEDYRKSLGTYSDGYFVPIEIGVTISEHEFQIATATLCIDPREYVRRRVYMDTVALMAVNDGKKWEELPIFRRAEPFVKPEKS